MLNELFQTIVRPALRQVLGGWGVTFTVAQLDYCYPPDDQKSGEDILVIRTTDTDPKSWLAAARAISRLFKKRDDDSGVSPVQVETQNSEQMYRDVSRILPHDPTLLSAFSKVRDDVFKTVRTMMRGVWSSIAFHIREDSRSGSSPKPTVVIFCFPGSSCDFEKVEDKIIQILETVPLVIHLEFLPGRITDQGVHGPQHLLNTSEKPLNGASIGIEGDMEKAGSLGGWVVLNLPKQEKKIQCVLTCYDVIRSRKTAKKTDRIGITLEDPCGHEMVEYPAACDGKVTIAELDKALQDDPDDQNTAAERKNVSSLLSSPGIGRVILASGYQTKGRSRLDWALIESPKTLSPNKPPPKSAVRHSKKYFQTADSKVRNFGRVKRQGDWVAKRGRTTGYTAGKVNCMDRLVNWEERNNANPDDNIGIDESLEIEIMSDHGDFAREGDVGSVVINVKGELVGIIISKEDPVRIYCSTFMTPIDLIQQHVKEMTDGGYLSLE